jgi:hypothetical protein
MRRAWLYCTGIMVGLAAWAILQYAPDLALFEDGWHSAKFTRMVGAATCVQGFFAALVAAFCLGRAVTPLTPAAPRGTPVPGADGSASGGGPVLPICGILFVLAAIGRLGQARFYREILEVEEGLPAGARYSDEIVDAHRRQERTGWAFGVLWVVVGGALLGTPLFLKPRVWHLGWRTNGVGWGIAVGGFLLSGLGALVCLANGMMLEGARAEVAYFGYLGVLAGAIAAVVGSGVAVLGKAKP